MAYVPKEDAPVRCPLEYGLETFGGKWKPRIICVLNVKGTLRYNELRSELVNVTDAVLSSALKELTTDGIVDRNQSGTIPPKVEYSLTDKGRSVVPILQSICQWAGTFKRVDDSKMLRQCQVCDHINR